MINRKFGRLTVVRLMKHRTKSRHLVWECLCECGNKTEVIGYQLRNNNTRSCGCLRKDTLRDISLKHGKSNSVTYKTWSDMIQRCENTNRNDYSRYGGRGIKVCERWHKFENFFTDMGEKPRGMFIERIDNGKGYCSENCRWATVSENNRNKRNNLFVDFLGERKILKDWSKKLNINYDTLRYRFHKGQTGHLLFRRA